MAQYKGYPIERMTSKPSTTTSIRSNPTSSSSIQGGYANINTPTTTRTNSNIQGGQIRSTPSSSSMARTSSNSIPSRYNQQCSSNPKQYATRTNPSSTRNTHTSSSGTSGYVSSQRTPTMNTRTSTMSTQNNLSSKYRALANQARNKSESSKYIRGIVIVTPQNETTHGWIYSKSTNMMYQLQWNNNKHYIVDQVVLFSPSSKLRGLKLEEARFLMTQNKLNINNYNNYFVNETISDNIFHTKLYNLDEINNKYLTEDSESIYSKDKFILNTFINLTENGHIEFKQINGTNYNSNLFPLKKIVNIMERYLNGFINMNGGTIYFGINDNGRICGQSLYNQNCRKILDMIQLKICERLREWKPSKYTQQLIKNIDIKCIDLIQIDDKEKVGYIVPNKKIIKATIKPIYIDSIDDEEKDHDKKQVIFQSSSNNKNVVYVRQLSSLCAYIDDRMEQQIGKRQIHKINVIGGGGMDESDLSDIDFDDDDEKDWIDVDKMRNDIYYSDKMKRANSRYFDGSYTKCVTNILQNIYNKSLPI